MTPHDRRGVTLRSDACSLASARLLCLAAACEQPRRDEGVPADCVAESTGESDTLSHHVSAFLVRQTALLVQLWILVVPAGLFIAWRKHRGDHLHW